MRIGFVLTNFEEMRGMLRDLPASVEARVMQDAVKVAAKPIVAAVKAKSPRRTGALRRSIIAVVRRYPKSGKVMALIGPDTSYYSGGKRNKRGASNAGADRPANYAHLVEFGHYSATATGYGAKSAKGTSRKAGTFSERSFILPRPFIRPGVMAATPAAVNELARGVEVGMAREVKRIASKMRRIQRTTT
jgi:HK97 gp10 family phage protein